MATNNEPIIHRQENPMTLEKEVSLNFKSEQQLRDWVAGIQQEAIDKYKPTALAELQGDARRLFKAVFGKEI